MAKPIVNDKTVFRLAHSTPEIGIKFGEDCVAEGCEIDYCGGVTVGSRVWILDRVIIDTHKHPRHDRDAVELTPLVIEDDVKIWRGAYISPGVGRIGKGSEIAPFAVVTKEVPENVLVAGNPGVIKRYYKE